MTKEGHFRLCSTWNETRGGLLGIRNLNQLPLLRVHYRGQQSEWGIQSVECSLLATQIPSRFCVSTNYLLSTRQTSKLVQRGHVLFGIPFTPEFKKLFCGLGRSRDSFFNRELTILAPTPLSWDIPIINLVFQFHGAERIASSFKFYLPRRWTRIGCMLHIAQYWARGSAWANVKPRFLLPLRD